MNNEVIDFINKINVIYHRNEDIRKIINIEELNSSLNELNDMIEMYEIKSVIIKHIQALIVLNLKSDKLNNFDDHMLHTVFYGHPGVGKSKTAKILTRIWKSLNMFQKQNEIIKDTDSCKDLLIKINKSRETFLDLYGNYINPKHKDCKTMWKSNEYLWSDLKEYMGNLGNTLSKIVENKEEISHNENKEKDNHLVIAGRENFVAEYTGQTAIKTLKFLESCKGKCIIIEEAYLLYNGESDTYGMEALTVLNRFMDERPRDVIIIFTGYEDKLKDTIFKVQPGLKRRCQWIFNLVGYSNEGLAKIFISQLKHNGWKIEDYDFVKEFFHKNYDKFENFGGDTSKLTLHCKMIYSEELIHKMLEDSSYTDEKFITNEILNKGFELYLKSIF